MVSVYLAIIQTMMQPLQHVQEYELCQSLEDVETRVESVALTAVSYAALPQQMEVVRENHASAF